MVDFSDESFPKEIEVIPLPGHFFDMVGFRMPDNVVFLADCISSRETLDKYAISFIYDVGAYLETLDKVGQMEAAMFVPAHAEASVDVKELVCYNKDKVHEVAESIILCSGNSPGGIQAKHGKSEILYAAPVEPCRGNGWHVQGDGMM